MIWEKHDEGDDRKHKTWQIDVWLNVFSGVGDDIPKSLWPFFFENGSNNHNEMLWYDDDMMLILYDNMMKMVAVNTRLD